MLGGDSGSELAGLATSVGPRLGAARKQEDEEAGRGWDR